MYRIPHGRQRHIEPGPRPVVLLQHGVTLASNSFVVLNQNESLAFILADAGFDVWMSNTRGNTYCNRHMTLNATDPAFWRISLDELALIDLPTQIDYMLEVTGASQAAYVGHSQGGTLAYLLLAERPEYNNKLSVVAHMATVAFLQNFQVPFLKEAALSSLDQVLLASKVYEFLPNSLTAPFAARACSQYPGAQICASGVSYFGFGPSAYITTDDYFIFARTWPAGAAARNFMHWAQLFRLQKPVLQKYDYGTNCNASRFRPAQGGWQKKPFAETCNQQKYGSTVPPQYDLSQVTAPQAHFIGALDVMAPLSDVLEQQKRLSPGVQVAAYYYPTYAHMDFVWDRNAAHKADLVELLLRFSPGQ